MKRLLFAFLSLIMVCTVNADVAQPGLWQKITLEDGTIVMAELRGDEFCHYWQTVDGNNYSLEYGRYKAISMEELKKRIATRRMEFMKTEAKANARRLSMRSSHKSHLVGQKHGIIILVDFQDRKFTMTEPQKYYSDMANVEGYDNGNQKGSVHDYFRDQSAGQFLVNFDIVGPVTMSNGYTYYGKDSEDGKRTDENVGAMICNAIAQASQYVNWKDYDWDGDGEVDQVYIIYAGGGQASGGGDDTIWPHKWSVSAHPQSGYKPIVVDDMRINTYACSNEVRDSKIEGIGTICHEFSHCLGFPDMYDTTTNSGATNTNYGMGTWDLMCSGSHNQGGYCPPGYSSWEKMTAGWIVPTELTGDMVFDNVESQADNGQAFIVYNQGNSNEYYMIENRQRKGWDRSLAGSGLMIMYIDYDADVFNKYNAPNTYKEGVNDHQRLTIFCADDEQTTDTEATDLYPNNNNDMLSNYTTPVATVYNTNSDGSKLMNIRISEIRQNEDGTMSFVFGNKWRADKNVFFGETFDDCNGTGANDGNWGTFKVGLGPFRSDETGWTAVKQYGAFRCARIGSTVENASIETPMLDFPQNSTLTFRAAPYANEGTQTLTVVSSSDNVVIETTTFQLSSKEWTEFSATISGSGNAKLTFSGDCRFYLDDVVLRNSDASGISHTSTDTTVQDRTYDLNGRVVAHPDRPGIYIRNGQKIIK